MALLHNEQETRIQDTTGGTSVMENAIFPPRLWRTSVFGRVRRLVCLKIKKREDAVCERNATPPPIILSFVVLFSSGLFLCSFLFFVVTGGITHSLNTNLSCLELTWAYYAVSVALLSSFSVDLKSRLHVYSTGLCCSTYSSRVRSLLKDKFAQKNQSSTLSNTWSKTGTFIKMLTKQLKDFFLIFCWTYPLTFRPFFPSLIAERVQVQRGCLFVWTC